MHVPPPRAHLVPANGANEHRRLQQKQIRVEKTKEMVKTTKQLEMEAMILEEQAALVRKLAEAEQKKADMRSQSMQKPKASFSIRDSTGRKLSKPRLDAPAEESNNAPWLVKKGCRGYEEAIRKKLQAQKQQEQEQQRLALGGQPQDPAKAMELENFLNGLGMNHYAEPVKRAGVTSVDQLKQYDLKKLNLLPGYEIKLAKRLAEFKATLEIQGKLTTKSGQGAAAGQQQAIYPRSKPPSATGVPSTGNLGMVGTSLHPKPPRSASNLAPGQSVAAQPPQPKRGYLPNNSASGPAPSKSKSTAGQSKYTVLEQQPRSGNHCDLSDDENEGIFGPQRLGKGTDCEECGEHYAQQTGNGFRSQKGAQIIAKGGEAHIHRVQRTKEVEHAHERSSGAGFNSSRSNKFSSIVEKHRSIHSDSTISEVRREQRREGHTQNGSWKDTSFKSGDSQEVSLSQETKSPAPKPKTTSSGTDAPRQLAPLCCWRCLRSKESKLHMFKSPLFAAPERLFCSQECLDMETREKFARCSCGRPAEKGSALCHNGLWYCRRECLPIEEHTQLNEGEEEFAEVDLEEFTDDAPLIVDNEEYFKQQQEEVDLDFEELI